MAYSEEKNVLMLMSLMKAHGIRKVIASPGTTNISLVASMQQDSFFELYSAYDERSAAYMACGIAAETGEAVALSCTQATASRNYFSGLTEAYYRKLPILAITSTQHAGRVGQGFQQAIDRTKQPVDTVKLSFQIPVIHNADDAWHCNVMINRALLELKRSGGGPVHLNLYTTYSQVFNVSQLPDERVINRISYFDFYKGCIPSLRPSSRIAIFVGAHKKWSTDQINAIDSFCAKFNAVVCCDQASNYKGEYRVNIGLITNQIEYRSPVLNADIVIHIGEITGAILNIRAPEVWRVDPNGEIMDTFKTERYIFEMEEEYFFNHYANSEKQEIENHRYFDEWKAEYEKMISLIPELPFSNPWIAQHAIQMIPDNSILHLGIYNSYRMWSMFEPKTSVLGYSNTGGFGIDGGLSTLLGASLYTNQLVFGVFGDLAFFYDMNSLCNHHFGKNVRILLINNGLGVEFKLPHNRAYQLGDRANEYICAQGHNGKKSRELIKHFSEDLGFMYLSSDSKESFLKELDTFTSSEIMQSIIFEVFVNYEDESEACKIIRHLCSSVDKKFIQTAKKIMGEEGFTKLKRMLGRDSKI